MSLDDEWESPSGSGMLTTSSDAGRTSEDVASSSLRSMNAEYSLRTGGGEATCTGTVSQSSLATSSTEQEREEKRSVISAVLSSSNRTSSRESCMQDRTPGKIHVIPVLNLLQHCTVVLRLTHTRTSSKVAERDANLLRLISR